MIPFAPPALSGFSTLPRGWQAHAGRDLPRYTSYPTAASFHDGITSAVARDLMAGVRPDMPLSVYLHTPFCDQLCWYCGCHTTVPNGYGRVAAFVDAVDKEIDVWAAALPVHAGTRHVHFGGGSPNSLLPGDFAHLVHRIRDAFRVLPGAEIAVELDPRSLTPEFITAMAEAGVTRVSLGVQTFDPRVQALVNRIQPHDTIVASVAALRAAGINGINFDLMYGLPGQDVASVQETVRLAALLQPDRLAVFGYAHVPWFKKHQQMIQDGDLGDLAARWDMAAAAEQTLLDAGYVALGLDHYALPDEALAVAQAEGRLQRNFQGYTDDAAPVLIPLGPSAIGQFPGGYIQNARATNVWSQAVSGGDLAIDRGLVTTREDRLRSAIIMRLMCDQSVDALSVAEQCGWPAAEARALLADSYARLADCVAEGLCDLSGSQVTVRPEAARLLRVVAACYDVRLPAQTEKRHAKAV
ncbi:MAG: oxygen-independent coproporphyrinogen III oxidase [Asticcacaulis sp.]